MQKKFFSSTREGAKEGTTSIKPESLIEHLRSDAKLEELNIKAAEEIASDDETLSKSDLV